MKKQSNDNQGKTHDPVQQTGKSSSSAPGGDDGHTQPDELGEAPPEPAPRKISKVDGAEKPNIYPLF
ncbi:MAG TPA: hypothetical protein QF730_07295 [Planctomycetota bacterium]|jgi:hypothetical protein|nr:hypothetical protein [Planctomycetota bacterium]